LDDLQIALKPALGAAFSDSSKISCQEWQQFQDKVIMAQRTRLLLVAVLYALMFFYAGVMFYFLFAGIGSYDGWTASNFAPGRWVITDIDPQGPTTLLQKGDVFVAINGQTRKDDRGILNFNRRVTAGTPYRMTVRRGEQLIEFLFHTTDFPPERRGSLIPTLLRMLVRLLFLGVGLGVFLLRRDSHQAWLMALLFGCMSGMLNESFAFEALGLVGETIISAARIVGFMGLPLLVHFFLNFPTRLPWLQRYPWLVWVLYLPALFVVAPGYGQQRLPVFLQSIWFDTPLMRWLNQYWFRAASHLTVAYLIVGLACLALNYRAASTDDRLRARVAMLGSSLGFLNILLVVALESYPPLRRSWPSLYQAVNVTLPFTLTFVPLSFAYAIIRHKVIPISLIIRRGVRYVLVSRGAILLEALIAISLAVLVVRAISPNWSWWTVAVSAIAGIAAWRLEDYLHRRFVAPAIDRRFFRQSYDAQRIIGELSDSLRTTTELPHLVELLATRLQAALQTESVNVLLKDEASGEFRSTYACQYDRVQGRSVNCELQGSLPDSAETITELKTRDLPLELEWENNQPTWTGNGSHSFSSHELQVLQILRPALLMPLKVNDQLSGVVSLGARLGDVPFSTEDKRLVMSVGAPTTLALENARLVERMIAEARRREEIEAENEARARELEEARQLQLSMLPKQVPDLPHLEIAAYMKTATEVGGDYYDFAVSKEGILTAAIGDATGHGLKAGTVVTATKSLFNAHAHDPSLADTFGLMSRALKQMNLRSMFMALSLIRVENQTLRLTCAGMPPLFIYRAATGQIEEHLQKAVPLGSIKQYPYTEFTLPFERGDMLLLMSDGLPERFNHSREMLGEQQIKSLLLYHASTAAPQTLIEHLLALGDNWADGALQDDDITLLILKAK
jgi:serine phosphatase RsbU (regulator of sigma subunit)